MRFRLPLLVYCAQSGFFHEEFTSKSIATVLREYIVARGTLPFVAPSSPCTYAPVFAVQFFGISCGSIILGVLVSLCCARILKAVDIHSEFAKFELSFVLISAYISYSVAELFHLSGIMALFFCGICNAHYGYYNTSHASKISSKYAFEALSYMAELFVFAYLGMQVVVVQHVYDWGQIATSLPLCLLARACNVFPLTFLSDWMG